MNVNFPLSARRSAGGAVSAASFLAAATSRRQTRGVALILVLVFITLCTVLVVAFFASVFTEGVSARAAASGNTAAQLAGSAVQLVEGTISYATQPKGDTNFAWACQPGMIRTYGSAGGGPGATSAGTASADPLQYFKLYSSDNMIVNGKDACNTFTRSTVEVPRYWDYAPALYADLNAPLIKPAPPGSPANTPATVIFPILDPRAQSKDLAVEGFGYTNQLTLPSSAFVDGVVASQADVYANNFRARLPMPVRWMYVLRDGTMTVPDGPAVPGSKGAVPNATWSASAVNPPGKDNPIVGRVAFWTDDESAKVNVNTASEGTFWDTIVANAGVSPLGGQPILTSTSSANPIPDYTQPIGDDALALLQPAQHEYQRYPGHPATTCLSTVLGKALGTYNFQTRAQFVQAFTDAIPRVTDLAAATSVSGTSSLGGTQAPQAGAGASAASLVTDLDRLYASLDEFQFTPPRNVQTLGASSNAVTLQNEVDACRFFLTAHSKAPELNLFGLPRVAMWPIWSTPGSRTAFEQEMARCSTVASGGSNAHQMIFQRANALSPSADWTDIARNQQVYGYLQALTSRPVPGFGGQFSQQYGQSNTDQILTEIFDYIRCTNLADNSLPANGATAVPYTGYLNSSNVGKLGQVVPITITAPPNGDGLTTHGLGRIATIGELALVLIKVDDRADITKLEAGNLAQKVSVTVAGTTLQVDPTKQTVVEWALVPKLVSPMAGYVALANNIRFNFSKINLKIGGQTTSGPYPDMHEIGRCSGGRDSVMGGLIGVEALIENGAPTDSAYPTGLLVLNGTSGSPIDISGDVTVQVYAPDPGSNLSGVTPLQTLQFNFAMPGTSTTPIPAPIPILALATSTSTTTPPVTTYNWYGTYRAVPGQYTATGTTGSFNYPTNIATKNSSREGGGVFNLIIGGSTDVVRSLVPNGPIGNTTPALMGDLRLLALAQNPPGSGTPTPLPATTFALNYVGTNSGTQDPSGTNSGAGSLPTASTYAADTLRAATIVREPGYGWGSLSASVAPSKYDVITAPEVPAQPTGTNGVPFPGDWDNGPGLMPDGPWANKPDEGVVGLSHNGGRDIPYIGSYTSMAVSTQQSQTLFSPNRQISSPVMFGSLPAGWQGPTATTPAQPWRTLLFRPATLTNTTAHPGGATATIRDHLLLDLFWMPVVEPYGISEPFATSGKINLNTQIMPFTYITRTTGLRAVMKSVMLTALNPSLSGNTFAAKYKHSYTGAASDASGVVNTNDVTRYPIDLDATIGQFTIIPTQTTPPADNVNTYPEFARGVHTAALPNFFVSASQICDVPLFPKGASGLSSFWTLNSLTGDNSLERPYSMIYPRVTTKSNIFTVHVLAQSLKKISIDPKQNTWVENKDLVLSEYRGAYTIEKYFDPNTDDLTSDANGTVPCLATNDGTISPNAGLRAAKWRLLSVKRIGQ